MKYINLVFLIILVFGVVPISFAQQKNVDSTKIGFGGPDQVEKRMKLDNEPKKSIFDLHFIQPYFDFKTKLKENSGLAFALDYSAAYFGANNSLGDQTASSGMIRFYGSWELVNRGKKNNGTFIYKIEHRHKYASLTPKNFGFEIGYVGLEIPAFNDDGFRMTNFYWRQRFKDGNIVLVAGLLDATDYVDVYAYASPWTGFMNFQFSTGSSSAYIPNDNALGLALAAYLTKNLYVIGSLSDAGSDPTKPFKSFETFFTNNDYFKSVELGYVSSKERFYLDNIHLTYWHSDGSEVTASLPGWGMAFSAAYMFSSGIHSFLRGGYAEDGGTLLQKSLTGGIAYQANSGGSLLGAAIGWGQPNETTFSSGLKNQFSAEVFYRIQFSPKFEVTPDLQYLVNPALNPQDSSILVWALRGRLVL